MRKNLGMIDRLIRVIIAIIICFLCINGNIDNVSEQGLLLFVAVVLAFNSVTGISLLYRLFGLNTNSGEMQDD
jgi:hypothetical protein